VGEQPARGMKRHRPSAPPTASPPHRAATSAPPSRSPTCRTGRTWPGGETPPARVPTPQPTTQARSPVDGTEPDDHTDAGINRPGPRVRPS
jgi:hypothetical protein